MIESAIPKRATSVFAALRYRDFRLLWGGLMISNVGTWMQFTAMGFFVAQVAGSPHVAALDLGILGASRAIPVLLLSPIAGVAADHLPRRRVLIATNVTMAFAALLLALLATAGRLDMVSSRPDFGAELGGERLRLSDAPKLGAVAGGAPIRRQRGRSQLRRFQCARRDRSRNRRPADRLGRRGRVVLRQRRIDARGRRCRRDDDARPVDGQAARTDVPRDAARDRLSRARSDSTLDRARVLRLRPFSLVRTDS